jgi:DNA-binding PadR family transcriptional regulator
MAELVRRTTDAELAILSLLAEQPMHGYQIEQTIEERGMREWVEMGFSSIYYLLNKLKKAGLLESGLQKAEGKGPTRQVFSLTPAGRHAWQYAALDAIGNPSRTFSNLQLGLSNIRALNPGKVKGALQDYRDLLAENRDRIQAKLDSYGPGVPFEAAILFDLSLTQITCELKWVEKFIKRLDSRNSSGGG